MNVIFSCFYIKALFKAFASFNFHPQKSFHGEVSKIIPQVSSNKHIICSLLEMFSFNAAVYHVFFMIITIPVLIPPKKEMPNPIM